ncbi:hypothetical protein HN51_026170, partial [Arachis hypogaea]
SDYPCFMGFLGPYKGHIYHLPHFRLGQEQEEEMKCSTTIILVLDVKLNVYLDVAKQDEKSCVPCHHFSWKHKLESLALVWLYTILFNRMTQVINILKNSMKILILWVKVK